MVKDAISKDQRDSAANTLGNMQAAFARTATRSIALYFSRPVRLFRPSKVSGWQTLRGLALKDGASLNPTFISSLVKSQGFMVIPKHFIPPMAVNALLGVVLWTTYGETSKALEPYIGHHPTLNAALSGAVAGGAQALVAAPAENVRLLLEGGTVCHSWSHAWKEVFRGTPEAPSASKEQNIQEMRQVRSWMKDVGEMAGRGWDGWGWGFAKDICGFAIFFSVFEVTRRVALRAKQLSYNIVASDSQMMDASEQQRRTLVRQFPRTIHGATLVTGGVVAGLAYEFVGRPWDMARRTVDLHRLSVARGPAQSLWHILADKVRNEGFVEFFRKPSGVDHVQITSGYRRRLYMVLRTLGRVGPWGVGFLVWEAYS